MHITSQYNKIRDINLTELVSVWVVVNLLKIAIAKNSTSTKIANFYEMAIFASKGTTSSVSVRHNILSPQLQGDVIT